MSAHPTPAGVPIFTAQISRHALQKWAGRIPRDIGAAIIAEAVQELLQGDCGGMKSLPFVSRLNARRKHRRRTQSKPKTT